MKKLILIFTILFSSPVHTQDFFVKGSLDCGNFLSSCDSSLNHINCIAHASWSLGFITGMNYNKFVKHKIQ